MPDNTIDSEVDELVEEMVNRFLGWKLPPDFQPDAGISFKPDYNEHTPHPAKHEPVGTNLFTATQAKAMIRYITDGLLDHKIAQEANKAYQTGYNTGWQKANRKHKRVWRQINDLKSTIDGIGELEGEAQ